MFGFPKFAVDAAEIEMFLFRELLIKFFLITFQLMASISLILQQ